MLAEVADIIVTHELGAIMKRIRKATEHNDRSIGSADIWSDNRVSISEIQRRGLIKLGYKVSPCFHDETHEFDDLFLTDVYIQW